MGENSLYINMNIKHKAYIDELAKRYPCFSELKNKKIMEIETDTLLDYFNGKRDDAPEGDRYRWIVPCDEFFGRLPEIAVLPIMFIGKTGYGKSSLLNRIIGRTVFPTDDIRSCTQEIDAAFFRLGSDPRYHMALSDFPGVGESEQADRRYMNWYADMVACSPCVVYVLRADQRDFSVDERAFERLFHNDEDLDKVLIALNFADKIEPLSRGNELSEEQLENLEEKVSYISDIFPVNPFQIFPCCAHTGYGIEDLLADAVENLGYEVCDE